MERLSDEMANFNAIVESQGSFEQISKHGQLCKDLIDEVIAKACPDNHKCNCETGCSYGEK